jgi:hypothetical protein
VILTSISNSRLDFGFGVSHRIFRRVPKPGGMPRKARRSRRLASQLIVNYLLPNSGISSLSLNKQLIVNYLLPNSVVNNDFDHASNIFQTYSLAGRSMIANAACGRPRPASDGSHTYYKESSDWRPQWILAIAAGRNGHIAAWSGASDASHSPLKTLGVSVSRFKLCCTWGTAWDSRRARGLHART